MDYVKLQIKKTNKNCKCLKSYNNSWIMKKYTQKYDKNNIWNTEKWKFNRIELISAMFFSFIKFTGSSQKIFLKTFFSYLFYRISPIYFFVFFCLERWVKNNKCQLDGKDKI